MGWVLGWLLGRLLRCCFPQITLLVLYESRSVLIACPVLAWQARGLQALLRWKRRHQDSWGRPKLSFVGAAERLWEEFIEPLQRM
jgi:hypothetical protein